MVNKPYRKYIDKKLVLEIEKIKEEYEKKDKKCNFTKASRILAGRVR